MAKILVGTWPCDGRMLRVYLDWHATSSSCFLLPKDRGTAAAHIGCKSGNEEWAGLVEGLLHEATELVLVGRCKAFEPWGEAGVDGTSHIFVFNHSDLQATAHYVAGFMVNALPEMCNAWKRLRKAHG